MDDNKNPTTGQRLEKTAKLLAPEETLREKGMDAPIDTTSATKYRFAAIAAADMADTTEVKYSDEDLKYKMSGKQFLAAIVISVVLVAILQFIPFAAELIYPDFVQNDQYDFDTKDNVTENMAYLDSIGIDMDVAAVDEPITFTHRNSTGPIGAVLTGHRRITIFSPRVTGNATVLTSGDEITCDYRSYPAPAAERRAGTSYRYVSMTVNGKQVDGFIDEDELLQLYKTALKRNDLKDEFKEESGMLFMKASLRKELTKADEQIFEMGIYRPYGYPYHADNLKTTCTYLSIAAIFIVLLGFTAVNLIRKKRANDAYMKKWNEESKRRWDEKQLNKE